MSGHGKKGRKRRAGRIISWANGAVNSAGALQPRFYSNGSPLRSRKSHVIPVNELPTTAPLRCALVLNVRRVNESVDWRTAPQFVAGLRVVIYEIVCSIQFERISFPVGRRRFLFLRLITLESCRKYKSREVVAGCLKFLYTRTMENHRVTRLVLIRISFDVCMFVVSLIKEIEYKYSGVIVKNIPGVYV